ncbi:MAG: hypothetical protein WCK41_00090 [Actinomycetes bacterium]
MAIKADHIARVVIDNEWISVERGTFEVVEMVFLDEDDEPIHDPIDVKAYTFVTPTGDRYFGPLSAITLFKIAEV